MAPIFLEKVWGGHRLQACPTKEAPKGRRIGESWEVADLAEGQSTVAAGPFRGRTLGSLVGEYGERLVGTCSATQRFPLLIKIIDAQDDLSVQVHPGAQHLPALPGACAKDESWVILEAAPASRILHGLKPGVDEHRLRAAIAAQRVEDCLRCIPAAAGQVYRVAPGTFHAIGRGVVLLEVQEPSDTTYRVWDFGRLGLDGKPRPLHIEQALQVAAFDDDAAGPALPRWQFRQPGLEHACLIDASTYRIEQLRAHEPSSFIMHVPPQSTRVIFVHDGSARVTVPPHLPVSLHPWQTAVIPAEAGEVLLSTSASATLTAAGLGGYPIF